MGDDWIEYGERIRSPWEAKFWAYYWRREFLSQIFIKVRQSHHNKTTDLQALHTFYARAEDLVSKAEYDMGRIMKGVKAGTPQQDYLTLLQGLLRSRPVNADKAARIMGLINLFAAKSGLDGETERFHKQPWDRVRTELGVHKRGGNDNKGVRGPDT
jgi:hypothetical protein